MNKLTYYCDGSCKKNPGPGGFGVIRVSTISKENVEDHSLEYAYQEQFDNTTNNRMELSAVIHTLKIAEAYPEYLYEIYSDSNYVVQICNDWIWKWACNNWTRAHNKKIENLDLVKELYRLLTAHKNTVEIKWCKGHAGLMENELVDALASNNEEKFSKIMNTYHIFGKNPLKK